MLRKLRVQYFCQPHVVLERQIKSALCKTISRNSRKSHTSPIHSFNSIDRSLALKKNKIDEQVKVNTIYTNGPEWSHEIQNLKMTYRKFHSANQEI